MTARYLAPLALGCLLFLPVNAFSTPPTTVTVHVEGPGYVSSTLPGISCPGDCREKYTAGTIVQLTAEPADKFLSWDRDCVGESPMCSLTVEGKVQVFAYFEEDPPPPPAYPSPVPKTGQINCYNSAGVEIGCTGTGQDGELQPGVPWPVPRFTDNDDGTVTDNLTGLIWLQQADCYTNPLSMYVTWAEALQLAQQLSNGNCGLSDGSVLGDWRLPSIKELLSLVDYRFGDAYSPALPNGEGTAQWQNGDVFTVLNDPNGFIQPNTSYWSSTTVMYLFHTGATSGALVLSMSGRVQQIAKTCSNNCMTAFWPVRGPEPQ